MNRKIQYKKYILIALGILLLLGSSSIGALDGEQLEELVSAVVLIQPVVKTNDGSFQAVGSGSGTIIDKEIGLILTNYHVAVLPQDVPQLNLRSGHVFEKYLISITTAPDRPPKPTFYAEFRDGDKAKDLAVIKITETMSGKKPNLEDVSVFEWENEKMWRSVEDVHLNEDLIILGYPPYAVVKPEQLTITITRGNVSGFFNDNEQISFPRAWVKTDAEISFGNSGGTAIDSEGRFFGVPTAFMEDPSQKTSLGLLRPVDLADVHVDAVRANPDKRPARPQSGGRQGQPDPGSEGQAQPGPGGSGQGDGGILESPSMSIGRVVISTQRPEMGMPGESVEQYRYGDVHEIYAFFTYRGFSRNDSFNFKWYLNNQLIVDNTFPWDQGEQGAYALPLLRDDGAAFPTGSYEVRITVNGSELGRGSFEITEGGAGAGEMIGLAGKVKSADTGKAIPGAAVAFLKPGVTVREFMAKQSEDQIAAGGVTDREGAYRVNIPAVVGKTYAVVVVADSYQPLLADNGITIQDVSRKTYYLNDILLYRY